MGEEGMCTWRLGSCLCLPHNRLVLSTGLLEEMPFSESHKLSIG